MNELFTGIFETAENSTAALSIPAFLICILGSLVIGGFLAFAYAYRSNYTKSFLLTMTMLPAAVCVVILMVNGNIGAGIAVAGSFSLVRFRSVPGTAREITAIFTAMACGLICGMGYIGFAALFAAVMGLGMIAFSLSPIGNSGESEKTLLVTIPEDLDYSGIFDDVFKEYTTKHSLLSVKTTNMGSLFKLNYHIKLKDPAAEKDFIDALRVRNGNLEIGLVRREENGYEL